MQIKFQKKKLCWTCCCVCLLGIVNVPSSAIKVSDLIIVEKVCAVYVVGKIQSQVEPQFYLSPLSWGLETKGILNQPSLNTGLLEGFYLQLILSIR